MGNQKKDANFSLKKMIGTVGTVLGSVHLSKFAKSAKIPWMKTNLPESEDDLSKKKNFNNIALAVGLPPSEVLVGKALAYGTLDPGFESLTSVIVTDKAQNILNQKNKYEFIPDPQQRDLGIRFNGVSNYNGLGGNGLGTGNNGSGLNGGGGIKPHIQGLNLRAPQDRVTQDRASIEGGRHSQEGHTTTQFPNTSALTKEEMSNIVPFRSYTFYTDLDKDKFAGYKGDFMLLSPTSSDVVVTSNDNGTEDLSYT